MTYRERLFVCVTCDTALEIWSWDTDPAPACPSCSASMTPPAPPVRAPAVVPDSIPGGVLLRHAICHPDGTPRRFDSMSDIRKAARAAGWAIDGETPHPPNADGWKDRT